MRRAAKSWSKAELQTLRELAQAGIPAAEIGRTIGRTTSAVQSRASVEGVSLGLVRLTWREADDTRLRAAVAASSTIAQVSEKMDRTESSVQMRMSRLGLSVRVGLGFSAPEKERIRELADAGWELSRIARQYGTTVEDLKRFLFRASA